jgi:hypothetical protein
MNASRSARFVASAAGILMLAGATSVSASVLVNQSLWSERYVSEAGVPDEPSATAYRLGMMAIAAGIVVLAASLRPQEPLPAMLLAVCGASAGLSGTVTRNAVDAPPAEVAASVSGHIHAISSSTGLSACVLAMLLLNKAEDAGVRRVSRWAAIVLTPVGIAALTSMVWLDRNAITGTLERALLVGTLSWMLALTARIWLRPRSSIEMLARGR